MGLLRSCLEFLGQNHVPYKSHKQVARRPPPRLDFPTALKIDKKFELLSLEFG